MPQLFVAILIIVLVKLLIDNLKPALRKEKSAGQGDFIDISEKWIQADAMPYQKNPRLLNERELAVFQKFQDALVNSRYKIYPHIRLADLLKVPPGSINRQEYQFRIDERSVDLVLLEAEQLQPLLGVNFVSRTDSQRQQISAQFADKALRAAGLGSISVDLDNPPSIEQLRHTLNNQGVIL